jgi:nitric oxide reductase NorD protein
VSGIDIEPWEPEESVGKLWHAFASRLDAPRVHDGARVDLAEIGGRLAVLFRGLGGAPAVEIRAVADEASGHRLSLRRRLGAEVERTPRASFDGEALRLPGSLAVFPDRAANAALYLWLAAAAAHAGRPPADDDPLAADLAALAAARAMTAATLADAPGLAGLHADLAAAHLVLRPRPSLPRDEAAVEAVVRRLLGDPAPLDPRAMRFLAAVEADDRSGLPRAPRGYRPFRPVPLWPELRPLARSDGTEVESRETEGDPETGAGDGRSRRARRRAADLAERKDSFILHKFEAILSWAEFINLNRRVEDDDLDSAKKAADDLDELGLGQVSKAPATRLKLHLDLAPEDVDREALSGVLTYPEWDARAGAYLPAHVRVLDSPAAPADPAAAGLADPAARRRIRAVRRQFEALRPARVATPGHRDGDELDTDAAVRSRVELMASGEGTDRVWRQTRPEKRDLAVSILLDVSRSTESAVTGRAVIDIEREALAALAWGLDACGDDFAINAFSSLRRQRVYITRCKVFGEPMSAAIEARIAALRPGFYTRLGAAVRHAAAGLAREQRRRRLLLIITDGKPNDLDHYEGRHGIEDSAMAVREARRAGHAVFGVAIDRDARAWFPRIFGRGGFALIPHPDNLPGALPAIYRQLVGA